MNEFSRTGLLIGEEGQNQLSVSTIAVFGVGGVGSHCIEALARCGVGRLILIDNDTARALPTTALLDNTKHRL